MKRCDFVVECRMGTSIKASIVVPEIAISGVLDPLASGISPR
jgi:hypothetical protein